MARIPKIFIDSSVLIAGLYSNKGGSAKILKKIAQRKLVGFISPPIIEETKRNIRKKFSLKLLSELEAIVKGLTIQETFEPQDIFEFKPLINIKDLHVLVFAKNSKADFLITLDKKHFKTKKLQEANLPFKILTPREFLSLK